MKNIPTKAVTLLFAVFATTFLSFFCAFDVTMAQKESEPSEAVPPTVRIVLPERFRVLTHQWFDLRIEAQGLSATDARLRVSIKEGDFLTGLSNPEVTTNNDNNPGSLDKAWTHRRVSFTRAGTYTVLAIIIDGRNVYGSLTQINVQDFNLVGQKSVILYIGDAMGTAYRDASRIVAQSTGNRFREGFFDELQEMDRMPVTGMVMTYALDQITPDSANTATAWSSGNKTIDGALNVFPDNNDFRFSSSSIQATKQFALDNPRVETLWEYLRRRHGYKTGIVSTADITDATPAGEGSHTITRSLGYDIARQFVDGTFLAGPVFDVILGGGKERFISRTAATSGDTRNLAAELQASGYAYVQTRAELNALPEGNAAPSKIIGLFRDGNMNVAYDKLNLARPIFEPPPVFGAFPDQPYLDEMTAKAIAALSKGGSPFILMVEGASIDKQSHPNHFAGQLWDTIEFDKSIGVGRSYLNRNQKTKENTLLLVTADHDQSMSIIGLVDTNIPGSIQNVRGNTAYPFNAPPPPAGNQGRNLGETEGFPDYEDTNNDRYPENLNRFKISVGYRTGNHTGSSVPITAEGAGALLFFGYFDQTDVFFKMARALSINTSALDNALELKLESDVNGHNVLSRDELRSFVGNDKEFVERAPLYIRRLLLDDDGCGYGLQAHETAKFNSERTNNHKHGGK